jgi:hypothetical protein
MRDGEITQADYQCGFVNQTHIPTYVLKFVGFLGTTGEYIHENMPTKAEQQSVSLRNLFPTRLLILCSRQTPFNSSSLWHHHFTFSSTTLHRSIYTRKDGPDYDWHLTRSRWSAVSQEDTDTEEDDNVTEEEEGREIKQEMERIFQSVQAETCIGVGRRRWPNITGFCLQRRYVYFYLNPKLLT